MTQGSLYLHSSGNWVVKHKSQGQIIAGRQSQACLTVNSSLSSLRCLPGGAVRHWRRELRLCVNSSGCSYFSPAPGDFFLKIQTLISPQRISIKYTQGRGGSSCRVCLAPGLRVKKGLRAARALTKRMLSPIYLPQAGLPQKMQFDNIKTEKDAVILEKIKYYNRGSSAWEEDWKRDSKSWKGNRR